MDFLGNDVLAVEVMREGAMDHLLKSEIMLRNLPYVARAAWLEWVVMKGRKSMDQALRDSEERYHEIFNNVNDGIHLHSMNPDGSPGKFIDVNEIACRMLLYTRDELLTMGPLDLTTGYHSKPVEEIFHDLLNEGYSRFETQHIRKDGIIIPVEINAHVVKIGGSNAVLSVIRDISDRIRSQKSVELQYAQLKAVIESQDSPIYAVDTSYRYINFNKVHAAVMRALYGAEIEIGKSIFEYQTVPEDAATARANLDRAFRGEKVMQEAYSGEDPHPRRYFRVYHYPIRLGESSVIGAVVFAYDMTEQKCAELELKATAEKYRTLIESANEGIFVIQDGKIPYANPRALQIIEYAPEKLAKTDFIDLVHPDDRKLAAERHLKRLRGESIESSAVFRIYDKSHEIHWLEINAVRFDWEGRPATLNFVTDITRRIKALQALQESEEKYRSVIENIQDVFYRTDIDGLIIMASPSLAHVFGYDSLEELIGKTLADTFYQVPVERKKFLQTMEKKGKVENYEVVMRRKDGRPIIVAANSHFYYDKAGNILGIEGILRDITEVKKAEHALVESLREKEVLLKEIHHRVKNNLQIVSGLMYLQARATPNPEMKAILSGCQNRISSMALLHENLYLLSDLASVAMEPYAISLVRILHDTYNPEERIRFDTHIGKGIYLDIDTGIAIGIIITELVTNAIKYGYPGSRSGTIKVSLQPDGEGLILKVADDGVGIPTGMDLLADKGLGMKLVRNLVRQIHGTLTVNSGHGMTIEIAFSSGIVKRPPPDMTCFPRH